jgi:hypothetical protein
MAVSFGRHSHLLRELQPSPRLGHTIIHPEKSLLFGISPQ